MKYSQPSPAPSTGNVPLRDVARLGNVSQGRISQIQREIEESGGIAETFPWAEPLKKLVG